MSDDDIPANPDINIARAFPLENGEPTRVLNCETFKRLRWGGEAYHFARALAPNRGDAENRYGFYPKRPLAWADIAKLETGTSCPPLILPAQAISLRLHLVRIHKAVLSLWPDYAQKHFDGGAITCDVKLFLAFRSSGWGYIKGRRQGCARRCSIDLFFGCGPAVDQRRGLLAGRIESPVSHNS